MPFYDRTRLIEAAIDTVSHTVLEEMIVASLAVILVMWHFRSALIICITLPLAVLFSFILMRWLNIPSNIMSLSGIAISIGVLVDASIVMVDQGVHTLYQRFGNSRISGDTRDLLQPAMQTVGRPIFFAMLIMVLGFVPVFALIGHGRPHVPSAGVHQNVRHDRRVDFGDHAGAGADSRADPRPGAARGRQLARAPRDRNLSARAQLFDGSSLADRVDHRGHPAVGFTAGISDDLGLRRLIAGRRVSFRLVGRAKLVGSHADGRQPGRRRTRGPVSDMTPLGSEFMPSLDEGTILDMPVTIPRTSVTEAADDLKARDALLRQFPEVESVVGKAGRAETATDPSPPDMIETVVNLRPREFWPKRELHYDDALEQTNRVLAALEADGLVKPIRTDAVPQNLINDTTMHVAEQLRTGDAPTGVRAHPAIRDRKKATFSRTSPRREVVANAGVQRQAAAARSPTSEIQNIANQLSPQFGPLLDPTARRGSGHQACSGRRRSVGKAWRRQSEMPICSS